MVEGSGGDQAVLGGNGMAAPGASGDEQRVLRRAVAVESKTVPGKVLLEHLLRRDCRAAYRRAGARCPAESLRE